MAFVKLDTGILQSTLWMDRTARELFITALLMAKPAELQRSMAQLEIDSLQPTGWSVPPGWYGFIDAAGVGIIRTANMPYEEGIKALKVLSNPEPESRSSEFDGRRIARVNGGFVVLNFMKYRDRDHSGAERARRYRARRNMRLNGDDPPPESSQRDVTESQRNVTASPHVVTQCRVQSSEADIRGIQEPPLPPKFEPETVTGLNVAALNDYVTYRREQRFKPLKARSLGLLAKQLAAHPMDIQAEMVAQTIKNGWQGVFELKGPAPVQARSTPPAKFNPPPHEPGSEIY